MTIYCVHDDCRADQIQDLRYISSKVPRVKFRFDEAEQLIMKGMMVRCRREPRKPVPGGIQAQFAKERP